MNGALAQPFVDAAEVELARRHLIPFAKRVYPGFEDPPHIRYIAERLEAAERGDKRKIAISIPVRHGKSVTGSQAFPAFSIGRDPRVNIIIASHSETLAVVQSRSVKHLIEDDRYPWPDVKISADSSSVQRFNVTSSHRRAGGGVYAVGVGGSITGRGANRLIIDDALHDGLSATERDNAWRWYTEVAWPRVEPGGVVIVIGARFAEDDLIGRILDSEDAAGWEYIRLPALSEGPDVDLLCRPVDEPLWPERMSRDELASRRTAMGSRPFSAQFQQDPVPAGGSLFQAAWLDNRYAGLPAGRVDRQQPAFASSVNDPVQFIINRELHRAAHYPLLCIQAVDSASSIDPKRDRSAIATVATDGIDAYILDLVYGRVAFGDLKRMVASEFVRYRNYVQAVYVEQASNGYALVDDLRRGSRIPVIGFSASGGKNERIEQTLPLWEASKVKLPRSAPWVEDFSAEALRYPHARHDDLLDAVCTAIVKLDEALAREHSRERFHRQNAGLLAGGWFLR